MREQPNDRPGTVQTNVGRSRGSRALEISGVLVGSQGSLRVVLLLGSGFMHNTCNPPPPRPCPSPPPPCRLVLANSSRLRAERVRQIGFVLTKAEKNLEMFGVRIYLTQYSVIPQVFVSCAICTVCFFGICMCRRRVQRPENTGLASTLSIPPPPKKNGV